MTLVFKERTRLKRQRQCIPPWNFHSFLKIIQMSAFVKAQVPRVLCWGGWEASKEPTAAEASLPPCAFCALWQATGMSVCPLNASALGTLPSYKNRPQHSLFQSFEVKVEYDSDRPREDAHDDQAHHSPALHTTKHTTPQHSTRIPSLSDQSSALSRKHYIQHVWTPLPARVDPQ